MIEYGITTSQAIVWFHVCPLDCSAYFYGRQAMLKLLPSLPEKEITSSRGRLCKLNGNRVVDGGFIYDIELPLKWIEGWRDAASDREAGAMAERIFEQCVGKRLFQMPATARRLETRAEQFTGRDYELSPIFPSFSVEVKADFAGGEWGTGNLFVQTHELHHKHSGRNAHRAA